MSENEKNKSQDIVHLLNKKFEKNIIQPASLMKSLNIERISTGSISMDIETGGGLPKGRLIEIYGREGSGKTYTALKTSAEAQKTGRVLWIDAEGVFDPSWAEKADVNLEKMDLAKPETAEQAGTILDAATRSGNYVLIVLDSVAALLPAEDLDKAMNESERVGNRAMVMNRIVRKLQSALNTCDEVGIANNTCVIFINQIREKIGVMFGNNEDTTGGLGIRYMASLRINMWRSDLIKEKSAEGDTGEASNGKIIVGVTLKFKTTKNKTFTPLKTGQFILKIYGIGIGEIDRVDEVVRYGIIAGVIKQRGPSTTYNEHKFLGKEACMMWFRENPLEVEKVFGEIKKVYK
jgi:recombination protein RecA